jgi:hypothetical protein
MLCFTYKFQVFVGFIPHFVAIETYIHSKFVKSFSTWYVKNFFFGGGES